MAYQIKTGSYTGDGNDNRSITGVGFQPDWVWIFPDDTEYVSEWSGNGAGDSTLFPNENTSGTANYIQGMEADGFQIGSGGAINTNGITYYYLAIKYDGGTYQNGGTYTGDGSDNRSITGVGFKPDFVQTQSIDGRYPIWTSTNLGSDTSNTWTSNNVATKLSNQIQALEADGFQVGSGGAANGNGETFYYHCFKDKADTFETGTYTGDGTDNRSITGVGFQPKAVFVKRDNAQQTGIGRLDSMPAGKSIGFNNGAGLFDGLIQDLESDGFQVGSNEGVNNNGDTYWYIAFGPGGGAAETTNISESLSISESFTKITYVQKNFSESLNITESFSKSIPTNQVNFADMLNLSEDLTLDVPKNLTDTITLSELVSKTISAKYEITDTLTISEISSKNISSLRKLSEIFSISETISPSSTQQQTKNFIESLILSENIDITSDSIKEISDNLNLSELITKKPELNFSESITFSEIVSRTFSILKEFSESITLSEAFSKTTSISKEFIDTLALTESFSTAGAGRKLEILNYALSKDLSLSIDYGGNDLPLEIVNSQPTDTPSKGRIRLVKSGSNFRIYVYFPNEGWKYVSLS